MGRCPRGLNRISIRRTTYYKLVALALCRLQIDVAVELVAEGLEVGAELADGDSWRDGQAHFHQEQRRAREGGGFLFGFQLFDVDAVGLEQVADAEDDAGLVHRVGLEAEGD